MQRSRREGMGGSLNVRPASADLWSYADRRLPPIEQPDPMGYNGPPCAGCGRDRYVMIPTRRAWCRNCGHAAPTAPS